MRFILTFVLIFQVQTPTPRKPESLAGLATAALSQIDGTLTAAGLKAPVRVIRDSRGVPHIYAQSTEDLFFAQGYVAAQDRLWQMEMWRRAGEGRMAEIGRASCREKSVDLGGRRII